jgi:hypothetical protein
MTTAAVFIVPAPLRPAADAFCVSMGWQEQDTESPMFSSALTDNGTDITHYGCRPLLTPEHEALLANPPSAAASLLTAMIVDVSTDNIVPIEHYLRVLGEHGLSLFQE